MHTQMHLFVSISFYRSRISIYELHIRYHVMSIYISNPSINIIYIFTCIYVKIISLKDSGIKYRVPRISERKFR